MIKTIKVKKQLRLDELIKYIFDNDITGKRFEERSEYKSYSITHAVHVTGDGVVNVEGLFNPDTKFTVEVEEEITEYTVFQDIVILHIDGISHLGRGAYHSIRSVRRDYPTVSEIHTLINGKLELIWRLNK